MLTLVRMWWASFHANAVTRCSPPSSSQLRLPAISCQYGCHEKKMSVESNRQWNESGINLDCEIRISGRKVGTRAFTILKRQGHFWINNSPVSMLTKVANFRIIYVCFWHHFIWLY